MHKIDTDTAVGNEFVDGNAAASIKATRLNAKWFNTIQRELCKIVESAEIALSDADDAQIVAAMAILFERALLSKGHEGDMTFVNRSGQNLSISAESVVLSNKRDESAVITCNDVTFKDSDDVKSSISREGFLLIGRGLVCEISNEGFSIKELNEGGAKFSITENGVVYQSTGDDGKTRTTKIGHDIVTNKLISNRVETVGIDCYTFKSSSFVETNLVNFNYAVPKIFTASSVEEFKQPGQIKSTFDSPEGGMIIVKNGTGFNILVGDGTPSSGSSFASGIVVKPGECIRYIQIEGAWKHVW